MFIENVETGVHDLNGTSFIAFYPICSCFNQKSTDFTQWPF